jgi:MoxR-like ATPase
MEDAFRREEYLAGPGLATAVFAALRLGRPLLLEGEPGVGKTEVARTLARIVDGPLIRLQCYEGIDAGRALYEWDYARQMLHVRALQQSEIATSERVAEIYGAEFLVERPLLQAIRAIGPRVLLIDELDRGDDEFDAFLLELLDDYGVTVPELGRFVATTPPVVVITSNRTRELHGAVKRRCLYHWIDFPDPEREAEIIRLRAPGVGAALATSVADAVARLRGADLVRRPGAAEAIDWARALALLGVDEVRGEAAIATLGWVVKSREDQARARPILEALAHG